MPNPPFCPPLSPGFNRQASELSGARGLKTGACGISRQQDPRHGVSTNGSESRVQPFSARQGDPILADHLPLLPHKRPNRLRPLWANKRLLSVFVDDHGFIQGCAVDSNGREREVSVMPPASERSGKTRLANYEPHDDEFLVYLGDEEIRRADTLGEAETMVSELLR
jgi:hypothetical protein